MNNTKTPFEQWHYTHGENTQGIPWVDKLVKAAWDAALEEAAIFFEAKNQEWHTDNDASVALEIRNLK